MSSLRECNEPMEVDEEAEIQEMKANPFLQSNLTRQQNVNYEDVAREYRQNNWGNPSSPFHACFAAATKKDATQAYKNAFRPLRSGGYPSLFIDVSPEKEKDAEKTVVVSKSATEKLSPTSKARILWESF